MICLFMRFSWGPIVYVILGKCTMIYMNQRKNVTYLWSQSLKGTKVTELLQYILNSNVICVFLNLCYA